MTVVSDSGPLIALGKLGVVDVLSSLYARVLIASAVYDEVVVQGAALGAPDAISCDAEVRAGRILTVDVVDSAIAPEIAALPLDRGEKRAVHLAVTERADSVMLDDLRAREEAANLGLSCSGTIGILISAYRNGLHDQAKTESLLNAILARPDIWISDALCRRALASLYRPRLPARP